MAIKHVLCEWARPFICCLPFARVRALALVGGSDQHDPSWNSLRDPRRVFFDRSIHSYFSVDLREWGGRWHYFTGRYYDQANRLLARKFLSPGDTYIDIGANHGVQSLAAARIVGEQGLVIAIEPNPATFSVLQAHVIINGYSNIRLFNVGLSNEPGRLSLSNDSNHPGTFSFRKIANAVESIEVPVMIGDELMARFPVEDSARVLVKIDTEGHEHQVLRGLKNLIALPNVAFVVEVTDEWLRQAGSSAQQLYDEMHAQGYESYAATVHYPWLRPGVRITPQPDPAPGQHDVLFARKAFFNRNGAIKPL